MSHLIWFFPSLINWTSSLNRLFSSHQWKSHVMVHHLFRIAECASDANPRVVNHKTEGGSERICKPVYNSVFGRTSVKQVEELNALQTYHEMKQIYSKIWVTSRSSAHCNTELCKGWNAEHVEGCVLADLPQDLAVERPNYYQTLTVGTLSKKDILI